MFLLGLPVIAFGVWMMAQTEKFLSTFGRIQFFEEHLGADGGSRLGYKLIGIIICFIGILILTGLFSKFTLWVLSPLIRTAKF